MKRSNWAVYGHKTWNPNENTVLISRHYFRFMAERAANRYFRKYPNEWSWMTKYIVALYAYNAEAYVDRRDNIVFDKEKAYRFVTPKTAINCGMRHKDSDTEVKIKPVAD